MFKNVVLKYGRNVVLENVKFKGKYKIQSAFDEAVNRIAHRNNMLGVC